MATKTSGAAAKSSPKSNTKPANAPSTTGNKSGGARGNNPPAKKSK